MGMGNHVPCGAVKKHLLVAVLLWQLRHDQQQCACAAPWHGERCWADACLILTGDRSGILWVTLDDWLPSRLHAARLPRHYRSLPLRPLSLPENSTFLAVRLRHRGSVAPRGADKRSARSSGNRIVWGKSCHVLYRRAALREEQHHEQNQEPVGGCAAAGYHQQRRAARPCRIAASIGRRALREWRGR